jgi:hypothetical protein
MNPQIASIMPSRSGKNFQINPHALRFPQSATTLSASSRNEKEY